MEKIINLQTCHIVRKFLALEYGEFFLQNLIIPVECKQEITTPNNLT